MLIQRDDFFILFSIVFQFVYFINLSTEKKRNLTKLILVLADIQKHFRVQRMSLRFHVVHLLHY